MKNLIVVAAVGALLAGLAGCQPPEAVKSALYTAQLSLGAELDDADAEAREPWAIPDGADAEQELALRERQVQELILIMEQANRNLLTVVAYYRGDRVNE